MVNKIHNPVTSIMACICIYICLGTPVVLGQNIECDVKKVQDTSDLDFSVMQTQNQEWVVGKTEAHGGPHEGIVQLKQDKDGTYTAPTEEQTNPHWFGTLSVVLPLTSILQSKIWHYRVPLFKNTLSVSNRAEAMGCSPLENDHIVVCRLVSTEADEKQFSPIYLIDGDWIKYVKPTYK